jgi:putative phosphoesterase
MNALVQQKNGLLCDAEGAERLEKADSARILVLSDTHGHYDVLEAIVREYGPSCDAMLFAGDGMWDIVQYMENAQESEKLQAALPPVVAFVAGNGDGDQYRVSLPVVGSVFAPEDAPGYSLSVPSRQIMRACGYSILLVHGHRHSVDVSLDLLVDASRAMDCDIAVFGHTHMPFAETYSGILALNPGSPARPRGRHEPGFALIDLDSNSTEPKITFVTIQSGTRGTCRFVE